MQICKERNPAETVLSETHRVSCWLQHPDAPRTLTFNGKEARS